MGAGDELGCVAAAPWRVRRVAGCSLPVAGEVRVGVFAASIWMAGFGGCTGEIRGFFPFTSLRVRMTGNAAVTGDGVAGITGFAGCTGKIRGFFPFTSLRVRMTGDEAVTGDEGVARAWGGRFEEAIWMAKRRRPARLLSI